MPVMCLVKYNSASNTFTVKSTNQSYPHPMRIKRDQSLDMEAAQVKAFNDWREAKGMNWGDNFAIAQLDVFTVAFVPVYKRNVISIDKPDAKFIEKITFEVVENKK